MKHFIFAVVALVWLTVSADANPVRSRSFSHFRSYGYFNNFTSFSLVTPFVSTFQYAAPVVYQPVVVAPVVAAPVVAQPVVQQVATPCYSQQVVAQAVAAPVCSQALVQSYTAPYAFSSYAAPVVFRQRVAVVRQQAVVVNAHRPAAVRVRVRGY